ncbi:hypothetical protein Poli38472_009923 [Pythium oligandrum]|uniref:C-CAP/cofactor C-like domain-containing protein n=1 Tax=Pythium oligandrum TaxID=41045 RepID=A0A8K1FEW1_PYTOL|nr:hypothetical protein Poli38472_009923 [Pythium oligandrum]|eukprot:TMW58364.1 hypothetical protein Poli38472_009923 [Pythium oligandrum]
MGNLCHAGPLLPPASAPAASKQPLTFGRDPTLKREDFIFSNVQSASFLVKLPGSVNGQQFLIEACRDCDIFVLDHCTSVQIDDCVNCRIVIGPCNASLFLRNCRDCTLVCAVQQFRTRDCEKIDVYLYSATEPIIETSSQMRFACFPLAYFNLQQQFDAAKFSVWNNRWSEIYNFTPEHGAWKAISTQTHISPLAEAMSTPTLWGLPTQTAEEVGLTVEAAKLVVPLTGGVSARREDDNLAIVIFVQAHAHLMMEFVAAIAKQAGAAGVKETVLLRSRQMKFSDDQAKHLFQQTHIALVSKASDTTRDTAGSVIMEFEGAECSQHVQNALQLETFSAILTSIFVCTDNGPARRLSELIFTQWKDAI